VAAFDRNRWPLSLGLGGRFPSESVAALARIPHWGYGPGGVLGLILVLLVLFALFGRRGRV